MPRIKIAPRKTGTSNDPDFVTKVIIAPEKAFLPHKGPANMVLLRHPRSGTGVMYLFSPDNKAVYEVLQLQDDKSSWFINDSVVEEGNLNYISPYDPVFHVLPYLMKCAKEKKTMPLDDALVDEQFPNTTRLLQCEGLKLIDSVAVRKGDPELNAWAYCEEKTLKWLEKKVKQIENGWKDLETGNSQLCNALEKPEQVKYEAFDALCEYLPVELISKLQEVLKIPADYNKTDITPIKKSSSGVEIEGKNGSLHGMKKSAKENAAKRRKVTHSPAPSITANKISNYFTKK